MQICTKLPYSLFGHTNFDDNQRSNGEKLREGYLNENIIMTFL